MEEAKETQLPQAPESTDINPAGELEKTVEQAGKAADYAEQTANKLDRVLKAIMEKAVGEQNPKKNREG